MSESDEEPTRTSGNGMTALGVEVLLALSSRLDEGQIIRGNGRSRAPLPSPEKKNYHSSGLISRSKNETAKKKIRQADHKVHGDT